MRMMTITAWDSPDSARQLMAQETHAKAMRDFFGDLSGGAWTGVWVPHRANAIWGRCPSCGKMVNRDNAGGRCRCGAALGPASPYW